MSQAAASEELFPDLAPAPRAVIDRFAGEIVHDVSEAHGMHQCDDCGAWFDDCYGVDLSHAPAGHKTGYGWRPGMPKPCCGGPGGWRDPLIISRTTFVFRQHQVTDPDEPEAEPDEELW